MRRFIEMVSVRVVLASGFLCLSTFALGACGDGANVDGSDETASCPVGTEGCLCTQGGVCDSNLVCRSKLCVDDGPGASGGAAAGGSTGTAGVPTSTGGRGESPSGSGGASSVCHDPRPINQNSTVTCADCNPGHVCVAYNSGSSYHWACLHPCNDDAECHTCGAETSWNCQVVSTATYASPPAKACLYGR